jgi:hypothetical protein
MIRLVNSLQSIRRNQPEDYTVPRCIKRRTQAPVVGCFEFFQVAAMEARLADHIWTLEELVSVLEAREAKAA